MSLRGAGIWVLLCGLLAWPIWDAARSPLLQWRDPVYIAAGLFGVLGLVLLVLQPLLVARVLPGARGPRAHRAHIWAGAALVVSVVLHILGLWITSPPDVIDVLLFRAPAPFSIWGVLAMWAVFGAAGLAFLRGVLRNRTWRIVHTGLVSVALACTVLHALLIEGTMASGSKYVVCAAACVALGLAIRHRRSWLLVRSAPR